MTVNNYTKENIESLESYFKQYCWKWIVAKEVGEQGTPHLQGAFMTKNPERFSGIFNKLGYKCGLQVMKGTFAHNLKYCRKDGDILFFHSPNSDDDELDLITPDQFFPWQNDIINMLNNKPNKRTINWFWEDTGNVGKTEFTKYLMYHYNACGIQKGKYADIMNIVFMAKNVKLFIVDIPRNNHNNISYNALESIKSGIIINTKYETGQKLINSPHIIVFANEPPDITKLSADRWNIVQIPEKV